MAAADHVSPREWLVDAPRSLRALSCEHRDGWGVACHAGDRWQVHRNTACAAQSPCYEQLASIEANLIIAHVRNKTVGETSLANTHPFQRGRFVFAHNGTVHDVAALVSRSAPEHLACIEGETDSERLFAFVLTYVDVAGDVSRGVAAAVRALHSLGDVGSSSFLLSCGSRLYAHCSGRSLFTLRRHGLAVVASEPLTNDEPWIEVANRGLVVLDVATATPIDALAA